LLVSEQLLVAPTGVIKLPKTTERNRRDAGRDGTFGGIDPRKIDRSSNAARRLLVGGVLSVVPERQVRVAAALVEVPEELHVLETHRLNAGGGDPERARTTMWPTTATTIPPTSARMPTAPIEAGSNAVVIPANTSS